MSHLASQQTIDAIVLAKAQESLDQDHFWRCLGSKAHGMGPQARNMIQVLKEPAYYDRIDSPVPVVKDTVSKDTVTKDTVTKDTVSKDSGLKKTLIGLGTAGAIGAAGLAGYLVSPKPSNPQIQQVDEYKSPLPDLRKLGYNLPPTGANKSGQ